MAADVEYGSLPFDEAIAYFRQKVNVPSKTWSDLWQGMHARAFTVAGATKAELLTDLRAAIDKAIAKGTTLEEFRKDFDGIVAKHGWSYQGNRRWRTEVMLNTNIRTAYQAGRYQQMTHPDTLAHRPYWEYRHGGSAHPRTEHLSWSGKVLPADDPWWSTHYPPNGWGCKCKTFALSRSDLKEMGRPQPDQAPDDGTYDWTDKRTGESHTLPNGIDPGWSYSVGEAAWGRPLSDQAMAAYRAQKAQAWERLTPGDWQSNNLAEKLTAHKPKAQLGPVVDSATEFAQVMRAALGAEERTFEVGSGDWTFPVLVNAESLASHLEIGRAPFAPLLPELLESPDEVWLSFERHQGTGKVEMRLRVLKAVVIRGKTMVLAAQSNKSGMLEAWTYFPTGDEKYVNRQRVGRLIVGKE